jgi:alkanesulfonate monooxygenase SsuD/methylene tetrahydromethanopterin reductase-like flavin-dependent oxidoreductase (luciferase family)
VVTTVGAVFLPQFAPDRLRPVAGAADRAGLAELWLWEDCFLYGGVSTAAAALAWTDRLRVGIGLLPVPLRNVAATAMEIATLEALFPGRAVIGVGHGVQAWMGQVGARVASPLTLLGEHLDALRQLLAGATVTTSGRYVTLDRVALDRPPRVPPPVLAGGEGPKTLALAGARSDGIILTAGTTPGAVAEARRLARPSRVVVYLTAVTGSDAAARIAAEAAHWGWPTAEDRAVSGDAGAVAGQVARWAAAGADTVVLQPTVDEPDPEAFVAFAAAVGRALTP